jgi:quercetin dioxygenase-like cupin family protein
MYQVNSIIALQKFEGLKVQKIDSNSQTDIISISLEKNAIFPEHTSPRDANLIVLEGEIVFNIKGKEYLLFEQHHFQFEKETPHWVKANENSKFLIIR